MLVTGSKLAETYLSLSSFSMNIKPWGWLCDTGKCIRVRLTYTCIERNTENRREEIYTKEEICELQNKTMDVNWTFPFTIKLTMRCKCFKALQLYSTW